MCLIVVLCYTNETVMCQTNSHHEYTCVVLTQLCVCVQRGEPGFSGDHGNAGEPSQSQRPVVHVVPHSAISEDHQAQAARTGQKLIQQTLTAFTEHQRNPNECLSPSKVQQMIQERSGSVLGTVETKWESPSLQSRQPISFIQVQCAV